MTIQEIKTSVIAPESECSTSCITSKRIALSCMSLVAERDEYKRRH